MRFQFVIIFLFITSSSFGQLYSTGLVFNDDKYHQAHGKALLNTEIFADLPSSASLKHYSPKPGNQLQLNTSPAWATAWSAKTILEAQQYLWSDRKEITHNTFSPAFLYYHIRPIDDETCESGIDLYDALSFLMQKGAKKYEDYLEFCPRGIPQEIANPSSTQGISGYTKLFEIHHPSIHKINSIKKSISENYPVVIGMRCPPSFYHAKNVWQPSELPNSEYPGHAMCIVGYDDNKYGGAFEVINSWGSEWGNDGFIWIRYHDMVDFMKYGYEIFDINKTKSGTLNFSGSVSLKLNTGNNIGMHKQENGVFNTEYPLGTGTYFRLHLNNDEPAFVYVFGIDEEKKLYRIFPHQENISPALIYKTNEVTIPGEDNYIEIIGDPGREKLCVLFSKESIDFNTLLYNLEKYPGEVAENLDALLEGKIISPDIVSWTTKGISFKAESHDKTALFIQILIDHI